MASYCRDYCNSLFFSGLSSFNQDKLQSIQNSLARVVIHPTVMPLATFQLPHMFETTTLV